MTQRFATVQEFWQAVQGGSGPQPSTSEALNSIGVSSSSKTGKMSATSGKVFQGKPERSSRKGVLISVVLAVLLILGIGVGLWSYAGIKWSRLGTAAGSGGVVQPSTLSPVSHPPTVSQPSGSNPSRHLASLYNGTIIDTQVNVRSPMTLTQMRQNGSQVSGIFNGLHISASYTGYIDASNDIIFTVESRGGSAPLYFKGLVQKNGTLSGSFYAIDQNGNFTGGSNGWWNVAPTAPVK